MKQTNPTEKIPSLLNLACRFTDDDDPRQICPYSEEINGKIVYCSCSPEQRRACLEDI